MSIVWFASPPRCKVGNIEAELMGTYVRNGNELRAIVLEGGGFADIELVGELRVIEDEIPIGKVPTADAVTIRHAIEKMETPPPPWPTSPMVVCTHLTTTSWLNHGKELQWCHDCGAMRSQDGPTSWHPWTLPSGKPAPTDDLARVLADRELIRLERDSLAAQLAALVPPDPPRANPNEPIDLGNELSAVLRTVGNRLRVLTGLNEPIREVVIDPKIGLALNLIPRNSTTPGPQAHSRRTIARVVVTSGDAPLGVCVMCEGKRDAMNAEQCAHCGGTGRMAVVS